MCRWPASLTEAAGRQQLLQHAATATGVGPLGELKFDQALGQKSCAGQEAYAPEREEAWSRRWRGVVGVVDCKCRTREVVQFLHVGLAELFLISSKRSVWLQDIGWARVSGNWCLVSLIRGGGRVRYVEVAGSSNCLSVGMTLLLANVSEGWFAEIKKQLQVCKAKRALRPS